LDKKNHMNVFEKFLYSISLLAALTILNAIWINKILSRIDEMESIILKTKELHEKGMLWKHKKEIPIERIDFLKNETYIYSAVGMIIFLLLGFAIYQAVELIQEDWFSIWNTNRINSQQFRIRAGGHVLIALIRVYPILAIYLLLKNSINSLKTFRIILPNFKRLIKIEIRRIFKC